jgi:hypothetical protein
MHANVGEATLVPEGVFPDDLDTTSLALATLSPTHDEVITSILDQMAGCVTTDGLFLVWLPRSGPFESY